MTFLKAVTRELHSFTFLTHQIRVWDSTCKKPPAFTEIQASQFHSFCYNFAYVKLKHANANPP